MEQISQNWLQQKKKKINAICYLFMGKFDYLNSNFLDKLNSYIIMTPSTGVKARLMGIKLNSTSKNFQKVIQSMSIGISQEDIY